MVKASGNCFKIFTITVLLIASPVATSATERLTSVLIFPIRVTGINLKESQKVDIRDYLGIRMTMERVYKVMPESQIKKDLGAAKVESYKDCYDESCRIDLTKTVMADKSLSVNIVEEKDRCRVTAMLYDIAQEVTESAADVETDCTYAALKKAMQPVAAQLSGHVLFEGVGGIKNGDGRATETVAMSQVDSKGITWVWIPGGTFQMGSDEGEDNAKPVHGVTVSTFEMAKTEVTVAQYRKCVEAGVCSAPHWDDGTCLVWAKQGMLSQSFRGDTQPIVCVTWNQAETYAKWVGGRLPTEAEWEYAARSGGQNHIYPWGNEAATCDHAVIDGKGSNCSKGCTKSVCSKSADTTFQGLCDMAGNVSEWVQDWDGEYPTHTVTNPAGPLSGTRRIYRWGAWLSNQFSDMRVFSRSAANPLARTSFMGFRVARSVR